MKKLLLVAIAIMLLAGISFAQNLTVTEPVAVNLVAGQLNLSATGNFTFANITLTGLAQATNNPTAIPDFTVNDATGSGLGWTVNFACPHLTLNGETTTDPNQQLALTYQNASALAMLCDQGVPADATNGPFISAVATAADLATSTEVMQVNTAEFGMGQYESFSGSSIMVPADFNISVLASQYAGHYTSTLTATLAQSNI